MLRPVLVGRRAACVGESASRVASKRLTKPSVDCRTGTKMASASISLPYSYPKWKRFSGTPIRRAASATVLPTAVATSASLSLLTTCSGVCLLLAIFPPFYGPIRTYYLDQFGGRVTFQEYRSSICLPLAVVLFAHVLILITSRSLDHLAIFPTVDNSFCQLATLTSPGYGDSIVLLPNTGITPVVFATPIVFAHFSPRRFSARDTAWNAVNAGESLPAWMAASFKPIRIWRIIQNRLRYQSYNITPTCCKFAKALQCDRIHLLCTH